MLSVYIPFVSTGTNSNPKACIGDSLWEWVINNSTNTLSRIRKDTYSITDTVSLPKSGCANITLGTYQTNNYIFTSSEDADGNIYRLSSSGDNPGSTLTAISITKTDANKNVCCSALVYINGYLWLVPAESSGISGTIIRLDIFNTFNKTAYSYTTSTTDTQVTVYTGITNGISSLTKVSKMYVFGNYVYALANNVGNAATFITKLSTLISGTYGVITPSSSSFCTFTYISTSINSIASDNINYIWMASFSSSIIYRMSINYITSIQENTPNYNITQVSTTVSSITTVKYGAGYLWVAGITVLGSVSSIVQIDVTTNTVISTIPMISTNTSGVTSPNNSIITNIDIYSEYMWITDYGNSALLKMKIYTPCFMEGTKILCLNAKMKEEYIPIENIRKGHLIKTSLNGFIPVCMIGKSSISNPGVSDRIKNRLYKCSKEKYPELFEELYITGCHSILVDKLTDLQREQTLDSLGDIFITDRKYRLMAYLDERSEPYTEQGTYTIWHLALEHNNYLMNYGIYANGLLVESTSKRYMKELSGMVLIE
jgi:hypothetical protein